MEIVFNEWFLDWHRPDAIDDERKRVDHILDWLIESDCQLVILQKSPFLQKLFAYRKRFDFDPFCRKRLKIFSNAMLSANKSKCRLITEAPALGESIERLLNPSKPSNFASDRYLFQSAESTDEKIIITTDTKLMKHFEGNGRYQLWSVEEFMTKFEIK